MTPSNRNCPFGGRRRFIDDIPGHAVPKLHSHDVGRGSFLEMQLSDQRKTVLDALPDIGTRKDGRKRLKQKGSKEQMKHLYLDRPIPLCSQPNKVSAGLLEIPIGYCAYKLAKGWPGDSLRTIRYHSSARSGLPDCRSVSATPRKLWTFSGSRSMARSNCSNAWS